MPGDHYPEMFLQQNPVSDCLVVSLSTLMLFPVTSCGLSHSLCSATVRVQTRIKPVNLDSTYLDSNLFPSAMHGATPLVVAIVSSITAHAHIAAYNKGMWCINGSTGADVNSNDPVIPMYKLEFDQWWMHAFNGCDKRPPNEGDFLTLPAGDSVVLELSSNQAFSSLSYGGKLASDWPNGHDYSDDLNDSTCITAPNLHAQNQSMAAGTALAISYESDVSKMTPENLVVISVAYNTPFKRLTTYDIPSGLPSCPEGGCICGWGWIPNGCGTPNMYLSFSRCQVENSGNKTLGTPQAPVWCEGESSACVEGPKQMLYWNQASGNNIAVEGDDSSGKAKSPGYNSKCGFADGAQNDIFNESSTSESMLTKKSTLQETGEGLYDLYARTSDRDGGESTTVERSILRWARSNLGY